MCSNDLLVNSGMCHMIYHPLGCLHDNSTEWHSNNSNVPPTHIVMFNRHDFIGVLQIMPFLVILYMLLLPSNLW